MDSVYGPQASRLVGRLRVVARSEAAMAVLDLLRDRGMQTTEHLRRKLGHANTTTVARHARDLEAEGLIERVGQPERDRTTTWCITEYGRSIV